RIDRKRQTHISRRDRFAARSRCLGLRLSRLLGFLGSLRRRRGRLGLRLLRLRLLLRSWLRLHLAVLERTDVVEQVRQRGRQLREIFGVQALIGSVGVAGWVLDPEQESRRAAEQLGQGTNEPNRAAAANRDWLGAEALLESLAGSLERRPVRVGHPPL